MPQFNLGLKPAQIEITLEPGKSYTQAFEVTNNSNDSVILTSSLSAWQPLDNLGNIQHQESDQFPFNFSLVNSDLRLGQEFILTPHQSRQLVLKIENPDTQNVDHYFSFFLSQKPPQPQLQSGQNLAKIGANILISTSTESTLAPLNIDFINLSPRLKDTFLGLKITGQISNPSSRFTHLQGKITLKKNNEIFWEKDIYPYTVLSQNSRQIFCLTEDKHPESCQVSAPLWPGKYQLEVRQNPSAATPDYVNNFFVFPYLLSFIIIFVFTLFHLIVKNYQTRSSKP